MIAMSVSQSVCYAAKLGFNVQKTTLGGPRNIVLDGDPDPHSEGEGKLEKILPIPLHRVSKNRTDFLA